MDATKVFMPSYYVLRLHETFGHRYASMLLDIYKNKYLFIYLLFTPWEYFTSALTDGLSLEFEWQQVPSSLQDSSQYSDRSW